MASGMRRKIMQLCLLILYQRMFFCGFVTVHKLSRVIGLVLHVKSKENPCGFEATENCVEVTNGAVVFPRERQSEKKKKDQKNFQRSHTSGGPKSPWLRAWWNTLKIQKHKL